MMRYGYVAKVLSLLVLAWFIAPVSLAWAGSPVYEMIHMKGVIKYITAEDTYGILAENGKKYQPVRLSRDYRRDGLEVVFDAKLRDDLIGAHMWGKAIEITKITRADQYVSAAEKEAIRLLLVRMEAFSSRDLSQLQKNDVISRGLSGQEFTDWLGAYGKFILRYVEITEADKTTMRGMCLYTRELVNAMALSGNVKQALLSFTLSKIDGDWKFTATDNYQPADTSVDLEQYVADLQTLAQRKYGTDDLAKWKAQR